MENTIPEGKEDRTNKLILISFISLIVLVGIVLEIVFFYLIDVSRATNREFDRAVAEQQDIMNVKCMEPRNEYAVNLDKYIDAYKFAFNANRVFDVLDEAPTPWNAQQQAAANELKIQKELYIQACDEAKAEATTVQRADQWDYFLAHWQEMMFGKKA